MGLTIGLSHSGQVSFVAVGVAGEGKAGGGISMFWVVDCFKCRGKEEDDHHSRNLRRKIEVGRMRLRDDDSKGRIRVLRRVIGDLDRDAFPATSFVGGGGAYMSAYPVSVPWRERYIIAGRQSGHFQPHQPK